MCDTLFVIKEKTENYKKYVSKVKDDCYSHEMDSNEIIILMHSDKEICVSFSLNLFYLYDYYYILGYYNFNMTCDTELKKYTEQFIRNHYFDVSVFDFDDDDD